MKILIVNGYSISEDGLKAMGDFEETIKAEFSLNNKMLDADVEFYIRDRNSLDDIIYEPESGFMKREAAMVFDNLDMIFITGPVNLLPWTIPARKLMILFRMCIRTNKTLYCSGFGFFALVFLCATNYEKYALNVINGTSGKGSSLGKINDINKDINDLGTDDYFLDNVTGDMYQYINQSKKWVARFNCGMHYQKASEEFNTIGKYILSVPTYVTHSVSTQLTIVPGKNSEVVSYLKKLLLQHWAVSGLPFEFLVECKSPWIPHPFNFLSNLKRFIVLATSKKGPQIILFRNENILSTHFHVNKKYPSTLKPLINFINHKLHLLKESNEVHGKSILFQYDIAVQNNEISNKYLGIENFGDFKPIHSGFSVKDQRNFIVENNRIGENEAIEVGDNFYIKKMRSMEFENLDDEIDYSFISDLNPLKKKISKLYMANKIFSEFTGNLKSSNVENFQKKNSKQIPEKGTQHLKHRKNVNQKIHEGYQNIDSKNYFKSIRAELLPGYATEETQLDSWVPGYQTLENFQPNAIKIKTSPKAYCRFREFLKMEKQDKTNIKSVTRDSAYMNLSELQRKEEREKKKFNLGSPTILLEKNILKKFEIPNYNGSSKGISAKNHQFRTVNKESWVSQADFNIL